MALDADTKPDSAEEATTATASDSSSNTANNNNNISSSSDNDESHHQVIKKLFDTKVEGGKSAWAMTLETLGMSDGKHKKDDIVVTDFGAALIKFREVVEAQQPQWEFVTTPFDDFQATKEDLYKAFVHWSRKGGDNGDNNNSEGVTYNVSKAFRRMESYVEWMNKNCQDMNLKGSTMKQVADVWKMKLTRDKKGRIVWWLDFGSLDLKYIKHDLPQQDTLRYFVWLCHLVLFDAGAQEHGFVMVESIGHKHFLESMTVISMDVGTKLDRLTIGVLPIKMEACYLYNNPTWMRIIMGMMMPFLGKKMRKRIITLSKKQNPQEFFEQELGKENIPTGVAELTGTIEKDIVQEILERLA